MEQKPHTLPVLFTKPIFNLVFTVAVTVTLFSIGTYLYLVLLRINLCIKWQNCVMSNASIETWN